MKLLSVLDQIQESPFYEDAQRGYETYFGVTQEEAKRDAAEATAAGAIAVAAEEAKTMRILAGAGVAVALAALIVSVVKR
jgi:hypothetical protein